MPIHATATGKVMLAFGKSSTLLDALARPLEAITEKTITDPRPCQQISKQQLDAGTRWSTDNSLSATPR